MQTLGIGWNARVAVYGIILAVSLCWVWFNRLQIGCINNFVVPGICLKRPTVTFCKTLRFILLGCFTLVSLITLIPLMPGVLHADSRDFELFQPTPVPEAGLLAESARTMQRRYVIGSYLQFEHQSIVLRKSGTGEKIYVAVPYRTQLQLVGAMAFWERLTVGINIPISVIEQFATGPKSPETTQFALNDIVLGGRYTLFANERYALGLVLRLRINTGLNKGFSGLEGRVLEPQFYVLNELNFDQIFVRINLGYEEKAETTFATLFTTRNDLLHWKLGAGYWFKPDINNVFGELSYSHDTKNMFHEYTNNGELFGGYQHRKGNWIFGPAAAVGLSRGYGVPGFRVLGMAWYVFPAESGYVPQDSDSDGLIDEDDQCPNEPEDMDLFEDEDGCPDPDNDSDGVTDVVDNCPLSPEDINGVEDEDGCPENDVDQDGITDAVDYCPMGPEDRDQFEDEDGCPDPDNDGDGIEDVLDVCPLQPENINGFADEDGCPDDGTSRIMVSVTDITTGSLLDAFATLQPENMVKQILGGQIEISTQKAGLHSLSVNADGYLAKAIRFDLPAGASIKLELGLEKPLAKIEVTEKELKVDPIFFASGKSVILKKSFATVDVVVQFLKGSPDINLSIEGHTDSVGRAAANKRLSAARAKAVFDYLVANGIEADRLQSKGYGAERPIADNATKEGRATNRRVEFLIVKSEAQLQAEEAQKMQEQRETEQQTPAIEEQPAAVPPALEEAPLD